MTKFAKQEKAYIIALGANSDDNFLKKFKNIVLGGSGFYQSFNKIFENMGDSVEKFIFEGINLIFGIFLSFLFFLNLVEFYQKYSHPTR